MAKGKKSVFFCQNCGHEEAKWLGQCPACGEWNTFVEEKIDSGITKGGLSGRPFCQGIGAGGKGCAAE